MKKLICGWLAVWMLALGFMGMGNARAERTEIAGEWHLTEIPMGDDSSINPANLGLEMTLTLGEDGTALLETHLGTSLEIHPGTWNVDGERIQCALDDRELSFRTEGETLIWGEGDGIFRREAAREDIVFELLDSFEEKDALGVWTLKYFEMGQNFLSAQYMNVDMQLEIQPGKIMLSDGVEPYDSATEKTEEGLRFIDQYDKERTLQMTTDGMLYMLGPWDESLSTRMYFERQAE